MLGSTMKADKIFIYQIAVSKTAHTSKEIQQQLSGKLLTWAKNTTFNFMQVSQSTAD